MLFKHYDLTIGWCSEVSDEFTGVHSTILLLLVSICEADTDSLLLSLMVFFGETDMLSCPDSFENSDLWSIPLLAEFRFNVTFPTAVFVDDLFSVEVALPELSLIFFFPKSMQEGGGLILSPDEGRL